MTKKISKLFSNTTRSVARMEEHSAQMTHDLTNVRARIDVLSRLVSSMRLESGKDAEKK